MAVCKQCAWTPKCEHCDVTLTYHRSLDRLVCHYCGARYPLPAVCPACKTPGSVEVVGYGTERVEDEADTIFPDIRIARMDLDSTRAKDAHQAIIDEFSSGKARILIGTQMVTKGLDFGGVRETVVVSKCRRHAVGTRLQGIRARLCHARTGGRPCRPTSRTRQR